jgi:hypothetical protein
VTRPKGGEEGLAYWMARIIFGLLLAVTVAVLTFALTFFFGFRFGPTKMDWTVKLAAVAGGLSGLLFIVLGPNFRQTINRWLSKLMKR